MNVGTIGKWMALNRALRLYMRVKQRNWRQEIQAAPAWETGIMRAILGTWKLALYGSVKVGLNSLRWHDGLLPRIKHGTHCYEASSLDSKYCKVRFFVDEMFDFIRGSNKEKKKGIRFSLCRPQGTLIFHPEDWERERQKDTVNNCNSKKRTNARSNAEQASTSFQRYF